MWLICSIAIVPSDEKQIVKGFKNVSQIILFVADPMDNY